MRANWDAQHERSTRFMVTLLARSALFFGRPIMRLVLLPIVGYFLLTSPASVRAARVALRRILQREVGWRDVARSFHCYAVCALDRIYLLAGREAGIVVDVSRPLDVVEAATRGGCLLLVAHLGSFEVMRTLGTGSRGLPLSILLDRQQGRMFIGMLERLSPAMAKDIIDAGLRGPQLVLQLKEALQAGRMVGMMADRARADERCVEVQFMGGTARLPQGPWMMAAALGVPVILGFGLYRGGSRYATHFELLSQRIELPRQRRAEAMQEVAQRYASRLEHYTRLAPYNWFNYYAFWQ
jgi:predicted LPLAT superfamily acyltransferase